MYKHGEVWRKKYNKFLSGKHKAAKKRSNENKYYDRDSRMTNTFSCEPDQRNNRAIITYGDKCYFEVDSVGEVDESVGIKLKHERKGNLIEADRNLPTKKKTDQRAVDLNDKGGIKPKEHASSRCNNQGKYSDAKMKSNFSNSYRGYGTTPNCSKLARIPQENQGKDRVYRKRKRPDQLDRQHKKQRLHEPDKLYENLRPLAFNRLDSRQRNHVPTWSQTSFSVTETIVPSACSSTFTNSFNDWASVQTDEQYPDDQRLVRLKDRAEITDTIAKELIKYRNDDQNSKQDCLKNAETENFISCQDKILPYRETSPKVDDRKVTSACIPTETDSRHSYYEQTVKQEPPIIRENLKNLSKEVLTQLVTEVYRAMVQSEQRNISTQRAIEIMRNNESIQIEFEDEEELLCLLQNNDDNFLLKHACGETLISPRTDIKICQTFTYNQSNKHECSDLHICKYFLLGNCSLRSCKFSHRLSSKHNMNVLQARGLDGLPVTAIKTLVRSINNRNATTTPLVCKFYNNEGGCQKESCMHLHVCLHYINGNCKFGNMCKRSHDICEQQTITVLKKHGLMIDGNTYDDIITLIKATLQDGEVKPKKDMSTFLKQSIDIVHSRPAVLSCGQLQEVTKNVENLPLVFAADIKENQLPEDDTTSLESASLPDFIPLGKEEASPNCQASHSSVTKKETTNLQAYAKDPRTEKHILPAWTSIWRSRSEKTNEVIKQEELIKTEIAADDTDRKVTDCDSTPRRSDSVKDIKIAKDNTLRDEPFKNRNGAGSSNAKDLEQTQSKTASEDKKETAADKNSNKCSYSEKELVDSSKHEELSNKFHLKPTQDPDEKIQSHSPNVVTTVILEMQDENASYRIRKTNDRWEFEDKVKSWKALEASDSDMFEKLFNNFADFSRQVIFQENV